jgi:hypothetical protein
LFIRTSEISFFPNYFLPFENELNGKNDREIHTSPENIKEFSGDCKINEALKF